MWLGCFFDLPSRLLTPPMFDLTSSLVVREDLRFEGTATADSSPLSFGIFFTLCLLELLRGSVFVLDTVIRLDGDEDFENLLLPAVEGGSSGGGAKFADIFGLCWTSGVVVALLLLFSLYKWSVLTLASTDPL